MKDEIENRRQTILNPNQDTKKQKLPGTDLTDE